MGRKRAFTADIIGFGMNNPDKIQRGEMMLQFILGGVGAGKTTKINEIIKERSASGDTEITLIVPEQFTFTCQKNVLALIGAQNMAKTDVLSFTALGEKLLGKPAFYQRRRLSDTSSTALMAMALSSVKKDLTVYGRSAEKPPVVREFLSLSSELKQNMVSPDMLDEAADKMESGLLKAKLKDIAAVLRAYNEKIEGSFFDPEDLISELAACASLDSYLSGRVVLIDSFRGFTAGEYAIIEHILACARDVYVSLCTDAPDESADITDFFAKTKNTYARIARIAKEKGAEIAAPVVLCTSGEYGNSSDEFERYSSPALSFLEYVMRKPAPEVFEGDCGNITLCRASGTYLECEYVAATIKKLIREENYRCRDIAVIARNIGSYGTALTSALKKYGIGIYEDYRKSIDVSPVMNVLSACVRACADNLSNESVMRYLKTGLAGYDIQDISELENYCYTWQISGKKWLTEWTANPDGFSDPDYIDKEDVALRLEKLNSLREEVIAPVVKLRKALSGGVPGPQAINALWSFFTEINLSGNVKAMAAKLADDGEDGAVLELRRTWKLLVDILDELYGVLENEKVTSSELSNLIDLMLSSGTSGNIPQGLDEITVGSADRIRISSPRVAFVIGANEGVFPPDVKLVSSLTVKERAKLEGFGIKLSDSGEWRLAEENLITYCALCCPTERLYVSCASCSADGTELEPGDFYKKIKMCFPGVTEHDAGALGGDYYAQDNQPAFEQLAGSQPGVFRETLKKYFTGKEDYSGRIVALQRAQGGRNFRILDRDIASDLFGRKMFISPSRIEQYYKCAFSYFCKYGINAAARKRAELDPIQIGNVNHKVLELLLTEHTREQLVAMTPEQIAAKVEEYMRVYYAEVLGSPDDKRFAYIFARLGESVTEVAIRLIEEFEYCTFTPVDLELTIGPGGEIPAYIPEGSEDVYIIGKIDRVDTCEDGGILYVRVIDYKSSDKIFSINEAVHGINLQMLVYLFTLWQNGGKRYGDNLSPAGILYRSVTAEAISLGAGADEESYKKARLSGFKMRGLVLSDPRVIELMEKGSGGILLPVRTNKDGSINGNTKAYAINLEGFAALKKKTDSLINEMASALRRGETDALPYRKKEKLLYCDYCDYKAVCGYEDDMDSRQFPVAEGKDVIANLENGGDGDVGTVE